MRNLTGTKLVILNAGATYVRMFLCAGLALFSSRWILSALGEVDFGLYAVIAGVMGFLSFLTGAMAGSAQRHFAFSIGQGDVAEVNKWFNASLAIHFCLAVSLVIIGLPFGQYMINHVLTIPPERMGTSHLVFLCTLVAVVTRVLVVPYSGMFTAKQRIFELSFYQIVNAVFVFGFAVFLSKFQGDRLLIYAFGMAVITVVISGIEAGRCSYGFRECRLLFAFRRRLAYCKELLSFGGWSLFGALGAIGSNQVLAIIINVFCGPRANASFGIANQVSGQANGIAQGLFNALAPEITSSEGRGDRERVINLSLLGSKFSVLMLCFILIPFMMEIDTVLALWLTTVPQYTGMLCRIIIVAFLIDKLTIGYTVAVAANGKIAGYQATLGSMLMLTPVIAWLFFRSGAGVVMSAGCALLITRTCCALGRIWWVRKLMNVPVKYWVNRVFVRCALSIIIPVLAASLIAMVMEQSMLRLFVTVITCGLVLAVSSWLVGLNQMERVYIKKLFGSIINKLQLAYASH